MTARCAFCGTEAKLTREHVFAQWLRVAFADPSVTGSIVYRQSRQVGGAPIGHSHRGDWLDTQARVICASCNTGWMNQAEESVRAVLPKLIQGSQLVLTHEDQEALATWTVKTILMLQHTHRRANQLVIPARDYTDLFANKTPSPMMQVLTAYMEPPGRGTPIEATVEFLAENRAMAGVARLMETEGEPAPTDLHAYTATLRIGHWVAHLVRIGSPQFIARLDPGPAARPYALTIWPASGDHNWPPRSLAEIGGMMALARRLDAGVVVTATGNVTT